MSDRARELGHAFVARAEEVSPTGHLSEPTFHKLGELARELGTAMSTVSTAQEDSALFPAATGIDVAVREVSGTRPARGEAARQSHIPAYRLPEGLEVDERSFALGLLIGAQEVHAGFRSALIQAETTAARLAADGEATVA